MLNKVHLEMLQKLKGVLAYPLLSDHVNCLEVEK